MKLIDMSSTANEPIVLDDEAKLLKEIERTKKLIADDPSYEVTLKEQEAQLALLQATGAPDVPTAVQVAKEERAQDDKDKKEAIAAQEESKPADSKNTKPKLGIQKGQVAVVDVEVTNPRKGDENGHHIFSVGGKSYAVKNIKSGEIRGWQLFNPEDNTITFLGKNKEEARTMLATLVNRDPNAGVLTGATVQDRSNSELLKAVVYTPPKVESVEDRIEKLKQKAKEAANKVISDKVDEYIGALASDVAKGKWAANKNTIVEFIAKTLANPTQNFRGEFSSLGTTILNRVEEDIISKLDAKAKAQIEKDKNEGASVVDEVDENNLSQEEPASEEDILESVEEVVETLSAEESSDIATELNVPNNPTSVSDALSTAYSDWLVNAKEFSDKVVGILKRVSISLKNKIASIAIAISILPTVLNSSSVVDTKIYDLNEVKSFGTAFREEQKKKLEEFNKQPMKVAMEEGNADQVASLLYGNAVAEDLFPVIFPEEGLIRIPVDEGNVEKIEEALTKSGSAGTPAALWASSIIRTALPWATKEAIAS